jgi:hypothetical protein
MPNRKLAIEAYRKLPLIRQPFYGRINAFPGFEIQKNQMQEVTKISKTLEEFLGRKLNILEIGTSQGYVTHTLSKLGHAIFTIDWERENYEFMELLKAIDPSFSKVTNTFIELDKIAELKNLDFDLAISLGSLEQVYRCLNLTQQKNLFEYVANQSKAAIWSLPIFENGAHWNWALPDEPLSAFQNQEYLGEIGWYALHSRGEKRPLILSSNTHVWNNDAFFELGDETRIHDHPFIDGLSRFRKRYKFKEALIKTEIHPLDSGDTSEIFGEMLFLSKKRKRITLQFPLPKVLFIKKGRLISQFSRQLIQGDRLDEVLNLTNRTEILASFIQLCGNLAKAGIFPNDLRPWNILWDGKRCSFIDFSNTSETDKDVAGVPQFICFLAITNYIWNGNSGPHGWSLKKFVSLMNSRKENFKNERTFFYDYAWLRVVSDKKFMSTLDYSETEKAFTQISQRTFKLAELDLDSEWSFK